MQMTLSDLTFCNRPRLPEKVSLGKLFLRCTKPKGSFIRNANGNKGDFATLSKLCPKSDSRQSPKNVISPGTFSSQISKGFFFISIYLFLFHNTFSNVFVTEMIERTVPNIISDRKLCRICRKYKGHCSAGTYVPQVTIVVCNSAFELRPKIKAI